MTDLIRLGSRGINLAQLIAWKDLLPAYRPSRATGPVLRLQLRGGDCIHEADFTGEERLALLTYLCKHSVEVLPAARDEAEFDVESLRLTAADFPLFKK